MDKFGIDSHKILYHVPRLYKWLQGDNIYPIYIEIGLFGGCNHRCIFCAFDFLGYNPASLSLNCFKKFIHVAAKNNVKSILYSGEGEPLLNKNAEEIIILTKKAGIDAALSTNGVIFNREKLKKLLKYLSWVRFSLDAGTNESHVRMHGANKDDFKIIINNLKEAVKIKKDNSYDCAIGVQFLLMPQNYREVLGLARLLSDIKVDYLTIKPYSNHLSSRNRIKEKFKYEDFFYLQKKLEKYSRKNFQVIFRRNAMNKIDEEKPYKQCLGLSFITHITAEGDVYPCNAFVGNREFVFGNIKKESFKDIWEGRRHQRILNKIDAEWDIKECRDACRLDEINRYLWALKNPVNHVNFI